VKNKGKLKQLYAEVERMYQSCRLNPQILKPPVKVQKYGLISQFSRQTFLRRQKTCHVELKHWFELSNQKEQALMDQFDKEI
jgi:hypothetical protein